MSRIQTNRVLPSELSIQSIDDILYSIGLCHYSVRDRPKRSVINKPIIVLIFVLIQIPMRIVSNTTDNEMILLLTADMGHYVTFKEYINIMSILLTLMALFSQMVYFYNHRIGLKPTFVRVFQVLSGSITPSSVGLNHSTQVIALLKMAKWLPHLQKNNMILVPLYTFMFVFGIHFYGLGLTPSLFLSTYSVLFHLFWVYYGFNIVSIQIFVLFILCKYFLLKLKSLNQLLREKKRMNSNRIRNILRSCDALYREINEYNSTYWSKFLFNIWSLLGILIVFMIHVIIFISIPIIIKISLIYFTILYFNIFLFILTITSSVNLEAKKSYKLFNSFKIKFITTSKLDKRRLTIYQIKVILFYYFIYTVYFRYKRLIGE